MNAFWRHPGPALFPVDGCPNWECHAQEEHNVALLRERTHEINEYWQEYAGALERDNKRYRRALMRSLAVIGANLQDVNVWPDKYLAHTPGVNDFTQDLQYIHGLVPEFKHVTDISYRATAMTSTDVETSQYDLIMQHEGK